MLNLRVRESFFLQFFVDVVFSQKIKEVIISIVITDQKDLFDQVSNGKLVVNFGTVLQCDGGG